MRCGALFAGYGGLEMGVQAALGGDVAWYSEIDKGALKILSHRYPDTPNIGDVTTVDWTTVPRVDLLTGGSPCQDLSHAGKRAGMTEGTRSNLWVAMREAIARLRPGLVVWENVRGAYSADADSALEHCPGCMGDGRSGTVLRALGRVLGDLSDLGYDTGWHGLRAADVGAPHGRFRVFVVAYPQGDAGRLSDGDGGAAADTRRLLGRAGWAAGPGEKEGGRALDHAARRDLLPTPTLGGHNVTAETAARRRDEHPRGQSLDEIISLLPTPRATDGTKGGPNQRGSSGDLILPSAVQSLLPTPAVNDMGAAYTPDEWDAWTGRMKAAHGNGNGHGKSLSIEAARLLQTPSVSDGTGGHETRGGARSDEPLLNGQAKAMHGSQWGDYADAINRWEHTLERPAPAPTQTSSKGNPQLSPLFVEWMMGLPAGWVTEVPHITRNEALKALGNGVVPQQAEAALRYLLPILNAADE